jgi:uncharacterized protein (DUF2236 family)
VQRLFTLGSLPGTIRDQLGAPWDARSQARFDRAQRLVRRTFRATPRPLRVLGPRLNGVFLLWLATRHVRQFDEKRAATSAGKPAAA